MKRKLLTAFCSSVCAMSLGLGTMLLFPASAAEQTLKNLALDADSFVTNSNIVENAVAFGTDGIRISDWGTSLSNGTAGVYYKEKVAVGETVSVKMSGYSQNGNNGRFVIQLGMTQTCQNASLYPWATAGNTGKVINMEFKPAWLELTTKDNGTYDSQTVASGNANKNGPLSGAYNVLDKAEHVVTVSKSDTETGISLTIAVDGQAYVENFALEETALQGDYYFSTGMQAWGDVTLSEEEYLSVSELTVSNVYEEADPLPRRTRGGYGFGGRFGKGRLVYGVVACGGRQPFGKRKRGHAEKLRLRKGGRRVFEKADCGGFDGYLQV